MNYKHKKRTYALKTYIYWIINNINSFNNILCKCSCCGKEFKYRDVITIECGYKKFKDNNFQLCTECRYFKSNEQKEKRVKTWINKYQTTHPYKNKNVQKKAIKTLNKKYGDTVNNVFQLKNIKLKIKNTILNKYGVEYSGQCPEKIKKTKETCLKKYNYSSNLALPNTIKIREEKCLKKYGHKRPPTFTYIYDNKYFDSKPELAYYIWLKDNNINFIFQPNECIDIKDINGKIITHYWPDFKLLDKNIYIEIKGDQFFDKNNNPICCYDKKSWQEKYNWIINNNVILLRSKDYNKYLVYCKEKFNSRKWDICYKNSKR